MAMPNFIELPDGDLLKTDLIKSVVKHGENSLEFFHEATEAICEVYNDQQPDDVDSEWWQESSIMEGILFALNNPEATPRNHHDQQCAKKDAELWVFGKEMNAELKTHPYLVMYAELPKHQQVKYAVFQALVKKLGVLLDKPLLEAVGDKVRINPSANWRPLNQ